MSSFALKWFGRSRRRVDRKWEQKNWMKRKLTMIKRREEAAQNAQNSTQVSLANAQMQTDISKFNETMDQQREQFNVSNQQAIEQADIAWRRQSNTINTDTETTSLRYCTNSLEKLQMWFL